MTGNLIHRNRIYLIMLIIAFAIFIMDGCKKTETDKVVPCPSYNINKPKISAIRWGLFSPAVGTVLLSSDVTLSWECTDVMYPLVFSVFLGTTSEFLDTVASNLSSGYLKMNGLEKNRIYYWQVVAKENIACGAVGSIRGSFIVVADTNLPAVITTKDTPHMNTAAYLSGNVIFNGSSPVNDRGFLISTVPNADLTGSKLPIGNGMGFYSVPLEGLNPVSTYYIKAYATNNSGTSLGEEVSFVTGYMTFESVKDIDDNLYRCVKIGSQVWMAENLKTTRYNDGASIPFAADSSQWISKNPSDKYCWYNNDETSNKNIYGGLYNFHAVKTGKLCPVGWHVPTDPEWHKMILFLDPGAVLDNDESKFASDVLREGGTKHWQTAVDGTYNGTGFTGLPAGTRYFTGSFYGIGEGAQFWTSTYEWIPPAPKDEIICWFRILGVHDVWRVEDSPFCGKSVRCVKN